MQIIMQILKKPKNWQGYGDVGGGVNCFYGLISFKWIKICICENIHVENSF